MSTFGLGHAPDVTAPGPALGNELVAVGEIPTPAEFEAAFGIAIDLAAFQGEVTTDALLAFNRADVAGRRRARRRRRLHRRRHRHLLPGRAAQHR